MKTAINVGLWAVAAILLVIITALAVKRAVAPPTLSEDIFREIPKLGMRVRPDLKQARVIIPGRPHSLPFLHDSPEYKARITKQITFRCSTNAFGHRAGPVQAKPAPGTTRIFNYGDSITFGYGVDDGQSYSAIMQEELARHGKFEVINAGNPGEPSHSGVRVLERLIIPLQPQVVLICLGTNDIVNQFKQGSGEEIYHPAAYDRLGLYITRNLTAMITSLRKHEIKAGVILPPLTSFYPFPEHRRTLDIVAAAGKKLDVPVFDLEKAFQQQDGQRQRSPAHRRPVQPTPLQPSRPDHRGCGAHRGRNDLHGARRRVQGQGQVWRLRVQVRCQEIHQEGQVQVGTEGQDQEG